MLLFSVTSSRSVAYSHLRPPRRARSGTPLATCGSAKPCPSGDPGPGVGLNRAEEGAQGAQRGVRVVAPPDQRVRIRRRGVMHGDTPQAVVGGPQQSGLLTDEAGQVRGV